MLSRQQNNPNNSVYSASQKDLQLPRHQVIQNNELSLKMVPYQEISDKERSASTQYRKAKIRSDSSNQSLVRGMRRNPSGNGIGLSAAESNSDHY